MKKITRSFFIASLLLLCISSYAQPTSTTFMRTFSAVGMNGGLSLEETTDGGFIGTGQHESSGAGSCDIYAYKVDACGNPQWFKTYGGPSTDGGKCIQQTSDGGYVIAGLATLGAGDYDMVLVKIDAAGNLQWSKEYGNAAADYGLYVQQTNDGGYILTGFLANAGLGSNDVALIKTDALGNTQWQKIYGGPGDDWGDYVQQTSDGGYMITGYTTSFGAGGADIYLLKVDALGNLMFSKTYGGAGSDGSSSWGIEGEVTSDGGYIISGNTDSYGAGGNDVLLIKTDAAGNLQWAKTYGGPADDQPRFVHQTTDHGYIITGLTTSFGAGNLDAYLIKTDSTGTMQWSKAYGGAGSDRSSAVRQSQDGGYALSIVSSSFGADYFDPVFMKTDSLGVVGCFENNCATIVSNVTPVVLSGGSEMVPTDVETAPALITNTYTPVDVFLCSHCTTIPAFVPSDTITCVGDSIYLYNTTSVGLRCNENWYVNGALFNGNKDTLAIAFSTPGTHFIQLIASCGNATDTNTISIHVYDKPVANFGSNSVCAGSPTQLTDSSTIATGTISNWFWDFGDASAIVTSQNPAHTYPAAGMYNATLLVSNFVGCADTVIKPVQVYYNPLASFTHADVCFGDSMHFNNTSSVNASTSIISYSWTFGDGSAVSNLQNPAHYYSTAGTYNVMLSVTTLNGCTASVTIPVNVFDAPQTSFTSSSTCLMAPAQFTNTTVNPASGTVSSWSWNFGDGSALNTTTWNPSHTYGATGNYTVSLITHSSNLGCPDTSQITITVLPMPVADFSFANVCSSQPMNFNDLSTTATGTISAWSWNFGDASALNSTQNPSHNYPGAGNYNVTLIAANTSGCADTVIKPVQVFYNPVAGFTHSDVCYGDSMYFNNTSTVNASTSIASYLWAFGDGGPASSLQTPVHYYSSAGTYTVTLVITTADGCTGTFTSPVNVFAAPQASFTFSNTCLTTAAQFTNTSVNPPGATISSWSWNFGDGSPLNTTVWSPSHTYGATGNYQVTLITHSSSLGCADTSQVTITVFPMPVANFSSVDVCLSQSMSFSDLSTISAGSVTGWSWNFGDGSALSTVQNPTHIYAAAGTYSVSLLSTSNNGCKDSVTKNVIIHPLPVAQFSTANVCEGTPVQFLGTSTVAAPDLIQSLAWNFADGASSAAVSPSHLYGALGTYNVQLLAVSSFGCRDSIVHPVTVSPNPVVSFMSIDTAGCEPLCMFFQDLSTIATGSNVLSVWSFGDGNPVNDPHCYTTSSLFASEYFSVSLTVTSDSGCVSSLTKNNYITVYPAPEADFTVQPKVTSIINPIISYSNLSTGTNSWNWNLGDGTILGVKNPPSHTYADTGSFVVTLITSTQYGCTDTASETVIIEPEFVFYIPNAFTPNGNGNNETFSGKGIFIQEYEMLIFDRWGNMIYKTTDINKPWDGKVKGGSEIAQRDVYVYSITVTDYKRDKHFYKGTVTLIR